MMNPNLLCPVCGSPPAKNQGSSTQCPRCHREDAFCEYFAGQEAWNIWKTQTDAAAKEWTQKTLHQQQANFRLVLGSDHVVFYSLEKAKGLKLQQYEEPKLLRSIRQYSAGKLHSASINSSNTVTVSGNNDYGQCSLHNSKGVSYALAAPRCTYLVNSDGSIKVSGACSDREAVTQWKHIQKLVTAGSTPIGLTTEGMLITTDTAELWMQHIAQWKDVADVAASGYVLALHTDGRVSCAGNDGISSQIAQWENIVAIAADTQYAVGLTAEGKVLLAGQKSFMDMGRSDAAQWENIIAVSASPQGGVIGGVSNDGQLHLAGLMIDKEKLCKQFGEKSSDLFH